MDEKPKFTEDTDAMTVSEQENRGVDNIVSIENNTELRRNVSVDSNETKASGEVSNGAKVEVNSELETGENVDAEDDKNENWENKRRKAIKRVKVCGVVGLATSAMSILVLPSFEFNCDGEAGIECCNNMHMFVAFLASPFLLGLYVMSVVLPIVACVSIRKYRLQFSSWFIIVGADFIVALAILVRFWNLLSSICLLLLTFIFINLVPF